MCFLECAMQKKVQCKCAVLHYVQVVQNIGCSLYSLPGMKVEHLDTFLTVQKYIWQAT